jgi:hypothetical protein
MAPLHPRTLRQAKRLIRSACLKLPIDIAPGYYREWTAELPAILEDHEVRSPSIRMLRALTFALDQHRSVRKLAPQGSRRRSSRSLLIGLTAIAFVLGTVGGVGAGVITVLATGAGFAVGVFIGMVVKSAAVGLVASVLLGIAGGLYFGGAGKVVIGELLDTTTDDTVVRAALGGTLTGAAAVCALVMTLAHGPVGLISLRICAGGIVPAIRRLAMAYRTTYTSHYKVMPVEEDT